MTATIFFEVFSSVLFVSGVMVEFNVVFQRDFLSIMIFILPSGLSLGMTYTGSLTSSALLKRSEDTYDMVPIPNQVPAVSSNDFEGSPTRAIFS